MYNYRRATGVASFGFRLSTEGVVQACQSDLDIRGCSPPGWQELTDGNTMKVDEFSVLPPPVGRIINADRIKLPCPNLCADGTTNCWPTVAIRELSVKLKAEARADSAVVRQLVTSVRARNLSVALSADVPAGQSCPSAP